jgi:hypothetical protein
MDPRIKSEGDKQDRHASHKDTIVWYDIKMWGM